MTAPKSKLKKKGKEAKNIQNILENKKDINRMRNMNKLVIINFDFNAKFGRNRVPISGEARKGNGKDLAANAAERRLVAARFALSTDAEILGLLL